MKRTTSTNATRGRITRIIARTVALIRCYERQTGELVDIEVVFNAKLPKERIISKAVKGGFIDTAKYTILEVVEVQRTGALYAMDIDTFIENADLIEDGITE